MRTIEPSYGSKTFSKLRLFQEDIARINQLLAMLSDDVRVNIGNVIYDDLEEAISLNQDDYIQTLNLGVNQRDGGRVEVALHPERSVISHNMDLKSIGVASEVANVLTRAEIGYNFLFNGWARFIGVNIAIPIQILIFWKFIDRTLYLPSLIIVFWACAGEMKIFRRNGSVSLKSRRDFKVSWRPSAQDVVKMVGSALLGGVVAFFVAMATKSCK